MKRKKNLRNIRDRTGEADLIAEAEATAGVDLIAVAGMIAVIAKVAAKEKGERAGRNRISSASLINLNYSSKAQQIQPSRK